MRWGPGTSVIAYLKRLRVLQAGDCDCGSDSGAGGGSGGGGGGGSGGGGGGGPSVDYPVNLNLNGWWRADYELPWASQPSAGASGKERPLIINGNDGPVAGTPVNGFVPASFDGVEEMLGSPVEFTVIVLAKATAASAPAANYYDEPGLYTDDGGGFTALTFTSSGVRAGISAPSTNQTAFIAQPTGQWFMAAMRYDGAQLRARVNSTDTAPVAVNDSPVPLYPPRVGANYSYTSFFKGDILEVLRAPIALSDAELDGVRGYFNSRYGLTLP